MTSLYDHACTWINQLLYHYTNIQDSWGVGFANTALVSLWLSILFGSIALYDLGLVVGQHTARAGKDLIRNLLGIGYVLVQSGIAYTAVYVMAYAVDMRQLGLERATEHLDYIAPFAAFGICGLVVGVILSALGGYLAWRVHRQHPTAVTGRSTRPCK